MSILEDVCRLKILPQSLCEGSPESDPEVQHIVARIVERIPHFQDIPDLLIQLAAPVATARDYARSLIQELGEPKRVEQSLWIRDPFFPVLFASPQEGLALLQKSLPVKNAFSEPEVQECFFLMTMRRHEYEVLGTELDGEMLKRGVLQTVVSFEGHRILIATTSKAQTRAAIVAEIVLFLASLVPEKQHRLERMKQELLDSQNLLKAQIHTLEQTTGEYRTYAQPPELQTKLQDGRRKLADVAKELAALPPCPDLPESLRQVRAVLLQPDVHFQVELVTMRVQDFGIKAEKNKGKEIQFIEFKTPDKLRLAVLFASMTRDTARQVWPELGSG